MHRLAVLLFLSSAFSAEIAIVVPEQVRRCLSAQKLRVSVDDSVNPFFIRGDIDGDTNADYVAAVKNSATGQPGILICMSNGEHTLFSAGSLAAPEGLVLSADQSLSAVGWTFVTRSEVRHRLKQLPAASQMRGEAVLLQYEGDRALIFRSGAKFKWVGWFQ